MQCEVCGKESQLKRTIIEGIPLMVCQLCEKFGIKKKEEKEVIQIPINVIERLEKREKKLKEKDIFEGKEEILVYDFPQRIMSARNKINLSIEELAKKINEKKTIIAKIESGKMIPTDNLIKKLEKVLNIKLMEKLTNSCVYN